MARFADIRSRKIFKNSNFAKNEKIVAFVTLEETIISNMVGVTPAGNEKDFSYLNMIDNSVPIPAGVYIRPMFPLVELTVDKQVMAYYE